jgi:hypothetical protein
MLERVEKFRKKLRAVRLRKRSSALFFLEEPVKGATGVALVAWRIEGLDGSFPEGGLHTRRRVPSHRDAR